MTKVSKLLGLLVAALVLSTGALLGGTGAAHAEPVNPARFVGTVMVDGAYAPAGTSVEAMVGGASCGVTTVFMSGGEARYALDVHADQPAEPGCGTLGAQVTFYIGGKMAQETGTWTNYELNFLDLTYVTPTPTATATPVEVTVVVTATPTELPPTPKPPETGQGTDANGGSGAFGMAMAVLGLGALVFGVGGAAAARRSR